MIRNHLPSYAIAAAILIVGLVAFGIPINSLLVLGFALACPLMMLTMMRGMHGDDAGSGPGHDTNDAKPQDRDDGPRIRH
jgi:hypothetical protein